MTRRYPGIVRSAYHARGDRRATLRVRARAVELAVQSGRADARTGVVRGRPLRRRWRLQRIRPRGPRSHVDDGPRQKTRARPAQQPRRNRRRPRSRPAARVTARYLRDPAVPRTTHRRRRLLGGVHGGNNDGREWDTYRPRNLEQAQAEGVPVTPVRGAGAGDVALRRGTATAPPSGSAYAAVRTPGGRRRDSGSRTSAPRCGADCRGRSATAGGRARAGDAVDVDAVVERGQHDLERARRRRCRRSTARRGRRSRCRRCPGAAGGRRRAACPRAESTTSRPEPAPAP